MFLVLRTYVFVTGVIVKITSSIVEAKFSDGIYARPVAEFKRLQGEGKIKFI